MTNPVKTQLDSAVEDLREELQSALLETGTGGATSDLEESLGGVMSAVTNVQDAINDHPEATYPGWFATTSDRPPPGS